jgi:hypothetical protein
MHKGLFVWGTTGLKTALSEINFSLDGEIAAWVCWG